MAAEILKGVGIYSTPFCIIGGSGTGGWGAAYVSNCGVTSDIDALVTSVPARVLPLVNAIELKWALPYDIPNDRTTADIVCNTEVKSGSTNAATRYANDPLKIHQSSMIAKGWGTGHCFYLGVQDGATHVGKHRFQCRNTGKLATGNLELAFQFTIGNVGKSYTKGATTDTTTKGVVVLTALTLGCELTVKTFSSVSSSAVTWYTAKWTGNIDGNTQDNKNGLWQSFIAVRDTFPSLGQKSA